ncbi:hypothetical protein H0H92_007021 [Tricholoma furcatifolium]|nr:hypothetical protein H0H92_007021 [Tricholoma furcatifolium]
MAPNKRDPIPESILHRPSSGITSPRRRRPSPPVESAPLNHVRPDTGPEVAVNLKKVTFQWVKGELIGKGSYARVYLGLNATTGEIMAVKQVELPQTPSDLLNSRHQEITEALKSERKTLMALNHPHIVQYLGYEESPSHLSIFLEYVPGGTISFCLQTYGIFSQEVTKFFTRQILDGLEYLHAVGIIHRRRRSVDNCMKDLKSDNILVEPSGVCKISDFGISKQVEDSFQAKAYTGLRGTIYWMAPEILDNGDKKGYDVKVDIWSIGCVVLEMWTGQHPWFGEELYPVMLKLSQEKSAPPIPPSLILTEPAFDFRNQCFQSDPHFRPSAAQLQNHRYLVVPSGWQFEPFSLPSTHRAPSRISRKSRKSIRYVESTLTNTSDGFPLASLVTNVMGNQTTKTSPHGPGGQSESDAHDASQLHLRRKSGDGPQVVFITPLQSPPSQISHLPNTSRSSLDTAGSVYTPRKGFRVVNPDDPELQTDRKPYVYRPPPLPNVDSGSPFSSRLVPPAQDAALEAYPPSVSSTSSSSVERVVSHSYSGRRTRASYNISYNPRPESDSDDDDDIWAKPPRDLSARGKLIQGNKRPISRTEGPSRVASVSDHEEWPRPVPAAVYENLQGFFKYDLEKAVVPITSTNTFIKGGERKKSIRVVAEDCAQSGARRRTKLWDSRVEELSM